MGADVILDLDESALAPGVSPVRIHYREAGAGRPLIVLHGGWGHDIYPFDHQIAALSADHRIVIPDRTGYGGSGRLARQETDFHHRAAAETFAVVEALGLERPAVWGHSDGAVIALLMGLALPGRLSALIVEATHLFRSKPASRRFFETMMTHPDSLGERVTATLAREHGERWHELIRTNGDAWLRIASERTRPDEDLYARAAVDGGATPGGLDTLRVPALVIHGAKDPRTEPGELDALRATLDRSPAASQHRIAILPEGGHSPHSERATAGETTAIAREFLHDHA
jgi:pimeloyl-ACP methyl ester carboxylesterase